VPQHAQAVVSYGVPAEKAEVVEDDVAIDVLIVGAGIQGLAMAQALRDRYSVWVVSGPHLASETLEAHGYFDAGYGATDATHATGARRAVGSWRSWFDRYGIDHSSGTCYRSVPSDQLSARRHLWSEVGLPATEVGAPPDPFFEGVLGRQHWFTVPEDRVANPAAILTRLRQGLEDRILDAEVRRFGVFGDGTLDHVELAAGDLTLVVVPRFVVLAAGSANAGLLNAVAARFSSSPTRIARRESAVRSQASVRQTTLCLRGDLPRLSGKFADVSLTSHEAGDEVVWLVSVAGHRDLRLGPVHGPPPGPDPECLETALRRLFALAPSIERRAGRFRWSAYGSVRVVHPALAEGGCVGEPAPARLDRFGMSDAFFALWPTNLSHAALLSDIAAEHIGRILGSRTVGDDGARPWEVARPRLPGRKPRWERPDQAWYDWDTFRAAPLAPT
jgi:hypothetical protein